MDEFSGLYKKMCEKATRLQNEWVPQQWDDCCKKGDYSDGYVDIVRHEKMSKEQMEKFKENNVWLPRKYQIEERLFGWGIQKLKDLAIKRFNDEFLLDTEKMKEIKDKFKDKKGDIWDVKALIFIMEYRFRSKWDYDKEEWIKIKK
jgi:hypothetical protein